MEQLESLDSLNLREKKKYSDAPETWKLRPLCCISNVSEEEVYYAFSESESDKGPDWAVLREPHAFALYLLNKKGERVLYFKKHVGIFSEKLEIFIGPRTGSVSFRNKDPRKRKYNFRRQTPGAGSFTALKDSLKIWRPFIFGRALFQWGRSASTRPRW